MRSQRLKLAASKVLADPSTEHVFLLKEGRLEQRHPHGSPGFQVPTAVPVPQLELLKGLLGCMGGPALLPPVGLPALGTGDPSQPEKPAAPSFASGLVSTLGSPRNKAGP